MIILFTIHLRHRLHNKESKRAASICRISLFSLVLVIWSSTLFSTEINSTPLPIESKISKTDTSTESLNSDYSITPCKQHQYDIYYHSNSELLRKYHLANKHYGSGYLNNDIHDENHFTISLISTTVPAERHKKTKDLWSNFQFVLNDRWQLGADLPDINSFANGSYLPTPRLTYDYGAVKLSTLYLPQIQSYNQFSVMGLYLIIAF